ncbi:MAG: cell division protein [Planctomycetota bacterium]|nr:cell division protein [Planctomycetota bacterium]
MSLTGTYPRNLDEKYRLAVPKRLRDDFGQSPLKSLIVAPGTEQSLSLFSDTAFTKVAALLAGQAASSEMRSYQRLYYARAERVDLDSQGRIRLPERLVKLANLEHDIVLLGVHDHAEIWSKENWQSFLDQHESEFDQLAAQVLSST